MLISDVETKQDDRDFCEKCIYRADKSRSYLYTCDYFYLTGKLRGCKPGTACEKRVIGSRITKRA